MPNNSPHPRASSHVSQPLPHTFAEALMWVEGRILADFDREIAHKQLYYHNRDHVNTVCRRASQLFCVLRPSLLDYPADTLARLEGLLHLCAIAHDAIQIFAPQDLPHTPRRREAGTSEAATIERLTDHITVLNQSLAPSSPARFTEEDLRIVREAIVATICVYDPADQAIYQPSLYQSGSPLSPVARVLALADIGALGIDGAAFYNQEGSLLFLEENPDMIPLLVNGDISTLQVQCPDLYENLRQRLLRRTRFQVSFARSRLARYPRETASLPPEAVLALTHQVFKHLTQKTICIVESTTPTDEHTSLDVLMAFFQFERYLQAPDRR